MKPRQITKNAVYMITRRTTQRLLLMRPSKVINECIRYCLAIAQRRSGVTLHALVFMSNHYHIVLSDPHGMLPVFTEELNKLIARALNCHHGRWENFWSGGHQTSYVRLETSHDVMAKTVYTLTNPTAAGLVSHGTQWPGLRLFRKGTYLTKKPAFFFRNQEANGALPDQLAFILTPPPIGHERTDDIVQAAVSAREKELRTKKKKFLGASAVLKQSVYSKPSTKALRRVLSPLLACRDKWRRIERLNELKIFASEYRQRRVEFLAGNTGVEFPPGTYQFVHRFGARVVEV